MSKYIDLIATKSDEEKDQIRKQKQAEEAAFKSEAAIVSSKRDLARAQQAVIDAKSAANFDPAAVVSAINEEQSLTQQVSTLEAIHGELFG